MLLQWTLFGEYSMQVYTDNIKLQTCALQEDTIYCILYVRSFNLRRFGYACRSEPG
jgi:hypothetical protein